MQDIIYDMPFDTYQQMPGLNASALKQGRLSPKHLDAVLNKGGGAQTAAMRRGSLIHAAVLEPELFKARASIFNGTRRGKAWEAFKADHDPDFILKPDEMGELLAISASVHSNQIASDLINTTRHEVSIFWEDPDVGQCKCRADGLSEQTGLVEVKTTNQIDPNDFFRTSYNLRYHWQLGWYHAGVEAVTGLDLPMHVIAVEQTPPYDVIVYSVPHMVIEGGWQDAKEIAMEYRDAVRQGVALPGIESGIREFELPEWAKLPEEPIVLNIGGEGVEV